MLLLLKLFILLAFLIHNQKRGKHNRRADPVQHACILALQDDLTDKRQWNGQTQANCDYQRGGEEHCVGPAYI